MKYKIFFFYRDTHILMPTVAAFKIPNMVRESGDENVSNLFIFSLYSRAKSKIIIDLSVESWRVYIIPYGKQIPNYDIKYLYLKKSIFSSCI